jgi:YidC/Oxa1 family membrane protein insertase
MELQRTRMILIVSLVIVLMALFNEWQKVHTPQPVVSQQSVSFEKNTDIPSENIQHENTATPQIPLLQQNGALPESEWVKVETDVFHIKISPKGGDLVRAELKEHYKSLDNKSDGVIILDVSDTKVYTAQTGLMGKDKNGPDSAENGRGSYTYTQQSFALKEQDNALDVPFVWEQGNGVKVIKTYHFKRGSYLIGVSYTIENLSATPWIGSFYGQAKQKWSEGEKQSSLLGAQMYQGAATYTKDKPYKKVSFSDMKAAPFSQQIEGGWVAFLNRYFICAWIPDANVPQNYFTQTEGTDIYKIGTISKVEVAPNSTQTISGQWYVGPEVMDNLKGVAPGLELTIDYGILWPISQLLFWGLKNIHEIVGNWGWSIIFLTMIVKLIFYKLSATSYRSMGRMRKLQPQIEALKSRCGEDKQKFSQSMLELYRKEKVNPLGGCLPILIQIPVFIALYYVLLESVELRQAPFMLWILDLSAKDPFYVLPLIMGASMILQQRMNPAPPDPIQAKIMMFMPVVFTVLFLQFPAGLVLYWVVNNILSIVQQWLIMRSLERAG